MNEELIVVVIFTVLIVSIVLRLVFAWMLRIMRK